MLFPTTALLAACLSPADTTPLAIENVRIASPGAQESTAPRTVLVVGGVVVEIAEPRTLEIPRNARVLRGDGRFLAPGFYDMHVHMPGPSEDLPRSFRPRALELMLESGITTARVARGAPDLLGVRDAIAAGDVPGPRLLVSAPPLGHANFPSLDEARPLFAQWRDQGYDFVKFLGAPDGTFGAEAPGVYRAYVAAARDVGLDWVGHVPADRTGARLDLCAVPGQTSVEHVTAVSALLRQTPADRAPVLAALAEHGVALDLNLLYYAALSDIEPVDALRSRPELDALPHGVVKRWIADAERPNPRRSLYTDLVEGTIALGPELRAAEVPLVLSASAGPFIAPGASFVREARRTASMGYTPAEILEMATLAAARTTREDDLRGTVEVGKVADLVLLGSDPFESVDALGDVHATIVGGAVRFERGLH